MFLASISLTDDFIVQARFPVTSGGQLGGGGVFLAGAPEARVHWAANRDAARDFPTYNERLCDVRARLPTNGSPWPNQQVIWPFPSFLF